jgi:hypothetical protein
MIQELSSAIGRVRAGSQLAGFSIAAHILKIHCEQSRSSTNRMLPQLDAY